MLNKYFWDSILQFYHFVLPLLLLENAIHDTMILNMMWILNSCISYLTSVSPKGSRTQLQDYLYCVWAALKCWQFYSLTFQRHPSMTLKFKISNQFTKFLSSRSDYLTIFSLLKPPQSWRYNCKEPEFNDQHYPPKQKHYKLFLYFWITLPLFWLLMDLSAVNCLLLIDSAVTFHRDGQNH